MTAAMALYTTVGGLWASVSTDFLQIIAAMVAIVVILPAAVIHFGGTGAIYEGIVRNNPAAMQFTGGWDFWKLVLSVGLVIFAGVVVPQYVWQRYYAARDERAIKRGLGGLALVYPAMAFIGAVPAFIVLSQGIQLAQADASPIEFLKMTPLWVGVPFAAVILLYVISTADSSLMALTSIWSVDIHKRYLTRGRPLSDAEMQRINKVALVLFALAGLGLAFMKVTIVQLFWTIGLMQVTLIGPILLGLFGTRVTGRQAVLGSVVGLIVGVSVYFWLRGGDEFTANMLALFIPIAIAYTLGTLARKKFDWSKLEGVSPAPQAVPVAGVRGPDLN
jgi:Na+/proline symporter